MSLPYNPNLRPKPYACNLCNCDENCRAFNLLGQPLDIFDVAAGIYAAGMYRLVCKHKTTGIMRDVGGVIDVGDQVLNFIPGNVIVDSTVSRDPKIKRVLFVGLIVGSIVVGAFIFYKLFFRK